MDGRKSPSWSTKFLNMFGKNVQPKIVTGEASGENRQTTFRNSGVSLSSSTGASNAQSNYPQEAIHRNFSTIQQQLNVASATRHSSGLSSSTSSSSAQSSYHEQCVPPNLSTVPQRLNIADVTHRNSGMSSSTGTSNAQNNYPQEANHRNFSTVEQQLHVLRAAAARQSSGLSSSTGANSVQTNYAEEGVPRNFASNGMTGGNENKRAQNSNSDSRLGEFTKSSLNNAPEKNARAKPSSSQQQQFRSTGSSQSVHSASNDDQNKGQSNRNQNRRSGSTMNLNDDDEKQHQRSWRAQSRENRCQQPESGKSHKNFGRANLNIDDENQRAQGNWRRHNSNDDMDWRRRNSNGEQSNGNQNRRKNIRSGPNVNLNDDDKKQHQRSWRGSNKNLNDDDEKQHQRSWRTQSKDNRNRQSESTNSHKNLNLDDGDTKPHNRARGAQGNGNRRQKNGKADANLNRQQQFHKNDGNCYQPVSTNYENVRNEGQARNKGQSSENGNFQRRKDNHRTFFGFKKFENYLKMEADSVVVSLHSDIEAFEEFLNGSKAYEGDMFDMLLAVLSEKVFSDESNLVSYQNDFVRILTSAEIMNRFRDKCMTLDISKFKLLYNVADFMLRRMPVSASDSLSGVVTFCIARLGMSPECAVLLKQFQELFISMQEKRQHDEVEAKARKAPVRGKFTDNDLKSFDRLKPPDDFREICIIPTVEELLSSHSSFLRPNKQSGSYADAEHYLDVQFRLLREDFLQPLKRGIQEYSAMRQKTKNPRMPKGSPIRLYYNVKCLTAEVKNGNLHYWVQLDSECSKIQWEKSRRLLPGNLVLLTKNNPTFDSVVFATVGSRNDDDLKKHRKLTIIPEDTQSHNVDVLCDDTDLLLIESEVYWESFRHVLKTAQTLNLKAFPLAQYIVHASTHVEPPPSLLQQPNQMMRLSFEQRNYAHPPLITETWPTADQLGLDANQFEAFRAALTKQFVIIQGPPGTGKTFVGLRVAEVILQNPQFRTGRKELPDDSGMISEYKGPLLCICYTNHALDQFLEGIVEIMNKRSMNPKIVRVGGRSKSTILSEFNLREILHRTNRQMGGLQWRELKTIEGNMKQNQSLIKNHKQTIMELERPTGIVQFEKLDDVVYQTLCFEFSSQLMDKLGSASFFKLTDSNVCNIKEKNATDIVKKWFEYVKVKPDGKAKVAENKRDKTSPEEEGEEGEEFYDMDELLEHRIIVDDDFDDVDLRHKFDNSNGVGRLHADNMSVPQSKFLVNEYEKSIQHYGINNNDTLDVVYAKQRNAAQVRESDAVERKRLAILSEICHCLNERRVKIPDVTKNLESIRRFNTMDSKNDVDRTLPSVAQRYAAYLIVAKRAKQLMNEIVRKVERELIENAEIVGQLRRQHEVEVLKNSDVVGMTTTGAAKFNDLLVKMKSRVVIVEEAAEVLEAHIVTSLTKYTDHLILIGDHKQLKPSTAVYDLSKKYDLDVSLFERMVNNNMTCYSLLAQHRMRSEIADLIRGSIYENLKDSPNVHQYESITGMTKDLFFLTHNKFEKSEGDTLSKSNEFEADYLAGLAGYLLKQGYPASSITVLTTYTGQMFLLKSQFKRSESLRPIHITCVDNFQGEENDIILLSLVRSNPEGKMGFLSVSNRVCVALSRSKKGLYIVGNMAMLSKQTLWSEINAKLQKRGQIGSAMRVVCQLHKTQSDIANREDFIKKCPEGGCTKQCGFLMKCSHYCPRFCHSQDLDHEKYRCRELCRKSCPSELAHPCQLQCHFGKVCSPCDVQVHKARSCGHSVTVSCHLSAEEGYCRTKVKRLLKCDHELIVDCSQPMDGWLCREIVDKILDCGHESKLLCHADPNQYRCKIEVKKKLPCTHYKNLKCFEAPTLSICKTFVEKQLPCGHDQTVECRFDPKQVTCSVKVTATLDCEHSVTVPCFQKTKGKIDCVELCEERLGCGHSCPLKCHYNKDRHHDKFRCKKPCAKSCPEGHPCVTNHECSSQCKKCATIVERKLPDCGHTGKMFCFESLEKYKCPEKCTEKLLCGHVCSLKCSDPCDGTCKEMTTKRTPICGHNQLVPCYENPVHKNCKEKIKIADTLCGHEVTVECNVRNAAREEVQSYCTEPCDFMFPAKNGCLHKCSGTCGACVMGTLHQKCNDKCSRPLICGHLCSFPCSKNCPPCKEKCQMRCEHSKCKKMCGDACFICKERCSWKCKHKRCTKLCGEMCNRGPCHEPCDKKLRCGHMCIGFCGEICPPLCRVCNSEQLLEFQLLYTEDEDDARFIWLPDCKHAIEVEGLTAHFNATDETGEIGLKKCPRCTTLITTLSGRFGNIIRKTFRDVAQVKNTFYGNREQNHRLTEEIEHNLQVEASNLLNYLPFVKTYFEKMLYFGDKNNESVKKLRQVDINTLNSLQQIWIWVKEVMKNISEYEDDAVICGSYALFSNITSRQLPLSAFEVDSIKDEIQRLIHKIQFYRRWNCASNYARDRSEAKQLHTQILNVLTSKKSYDEKSRQTVIDCTKNLEKLLNTGLGISDGERMDIIKALNMRQGHWFKCPNGHLYLIGECGGAMETAKCNECGADIGGSHHSLLRNNQFAPEMDGADRPAYPTLMVPQNFGL